MEEKGLVITPENYKIQLEIMNDHPKMELRMYAFVKNDRVMSEKEILAMHAAIDRMRGLEPAGEER